MPPSSFVFDLAHGGQPFDIAGDLSYVDLEQLCKDLQEELISDEKIVSIREYCRRARSATGRAIMFSGMYSGLTYRGGIPEWSMMCISDPDHVKEVHEIVTDNDVENFRRLLPEIKDSVDILMLNSTDHGLQTNTILPPPVFNEVFVPYYRKVNDAIAEVAPGLKTYLHCCGAIYDIIDGIIESGFDILNPVQWPAGKQSHKEWKDKARGRIVLWGGGVNTQITLPLGSVDDVTRETTEVVAYLKQDGGYVTCAIHNILAEIPPEKIIAFYRAAAGA
jgi:uroporphyrinogen decarboxylase